MGIRNSSFLSCAYFLFLAGVQAKEIEPCSGRGHIMSLTECLDRIIVLLGRSVKELMVPGESLASSEKIQFIIIMLIALISMCALSFGWNSAPWFTLSRHYVPNDFLFIVMKIRWWMISHEESNILKEM